MRFRTSMLTAVVLVIAAEAVVAQDVVRLKNGKCLCGTIIIDESDDKGFTVNLWDTDGSVYVLWSQIPKSEMSRLLNWTADPGLTASIGEILEGVRVITEHREVVGVLTGETDRDLYVKTSESPSPTAIPKSAILKRESLKIRETDAYQPEEMVERRIQGDMTPARLIELGDFARALGLYAKAKDFYRRAGEADPARKDEMDKTIEQIDAAIREEEAEKALKVIQKLEEAAQFDEAIEAADKFLSDFEETELGQRNKDIVKRLEAEKKDFDANRDKILARRIPEIWRSVRNSLWGKAADHKNSFKEAESATVGMDAEIVKTVMERIRCTEDEVNKFWGMRDEKPMTVSMGSGSWLDLGGQDGGDDWSGEQEKSDPADDFARRFEEREKNLPPGALDGQKKKQAKGVKLQKKDEWWASATSSMRLRWVQCFYARNSAMVKKLKEELKDCEYCRGAGTVKAERGGREANVICPRCHGAKKDLSVTFQ